MPTPIFDEEDWNYLHQVLNDQGLIQKYPNREKNPIMACQYYADCFEMWKEIMQPKWSLDSKYQDVTKAQMQGLIKRKGLSFKKYIKARDDPNGFQCKEEYLNNQDDSGSFGLGLDGEPYLPSEDLESSQDPDDVVKSKKNVKPGSAKSSSSKIFSPSKESIGLRSFVLIGGDKSMDLESQYLKSKVIKPKQIKIRSKHHGSSKSRIENEEAELQLELTRKKLKTESKLLEKLELETQIAEERLRTMRQEKEIKREILELIKKKLEDGDTSSTVDAMQMVSTMMS